MDSSRWKPSKVTKDANNSRQDFGIRILGCARYFFIDYFDKRRTISSEYYIALLVRLKEEIAKKRPQINKKVLFNQDNATCHKSIATMAKLDELHFELLLHPLDLASRDYWLFPDLERNFAPMKKWYRKLRRVLRSKTNRSTKKASNC